MQGRAAKRHKLAVKRKRADGILRQRGIDETAGGDRMEVRTKKFATSHWGCACLFCANPRKSFRGKRSASLPPKELHAVIHMDEE